MIGVGLVFEVGHIQLSMKLETIAFSIIFGMTMIHVLQTFIDFVEFCRNTDNSSAKILGSTK